VKRFRQDTVEIWEEEKGIWMLILDVAAVKPQ